MRDLIQARAAVDLVVSGQRAAEVEDVVAAKAADVVVAALDDEEEVGCRSAGDDVVAAVAHQPVARPATPFTVTVTVTVLPPVTV